MRPSGNGKRRASRAHDRLRAATASPARAGPSAPAGLRLLGRCCRVGLLPAARHAPPRWWGCRRRRPSPLSYPPPRPLSTANWEQAAANDSERSSAPFTAPAAVVHRPRRHRPFRWRGSRLRWSALAGFVLLGRRFEEGRAVNARAGASATTFDQPGSLRSPAHLATASRFTPTNSASWPCARSDTCTARRGPGDGQGRSAT